MKRIKAACICQTLHFMLKEDVAHDWAVKQVEQDVESYQTMCEELRNVRNELSLRFAPYRCWKNNYLQFLRTSAKMLWRQNIITDTIQEGNSAI